MTAVAETSTQVLRTVRGNYRPAATVTLRALRLFPNSAKRREQGVLDSGFAELERLCEH